MSRSRNVSAASNVARVRTLASAKRDIQRHLTYKNIRSSRTALLDGIERFRDALKSLPVSGRSLGHNASGAEFFARLSMTEYLWIWAYMPGALDTEDRRTGWVSLVHLYHVSELRRAPTDVRTLGDLPAVFVD